MSAFIDITGQKFNHLLVVERMENAPSGIPVWKCVCDCGNFTVVRGKNLKSGAVKSCGCAKKIPPNVSHRMTHTRLYETWSNMRRRCNSKSSKSYKDYGGRGIKVCDSWNRSFIDFYNWAIESGYSDNLTIDRIDVNGDYCPENCRWVPKGDQPSNRRNNWRITHRGKTQNLKQWCDELGLDYKLINNRLNRSGLSFEEAIALPKHWERKRSKE